jgi:hypothetical protein
VQQSSNDYDGSHLTFFLKVSGGKVNLRGLPLSVANGSVNVELSLKANSVAEAQIDHLILDVSIGNLILPGGVPDKWRTRYRYPADLAPTDNPEVSLRIENFHGVASYVSPKTSLKASGDVELQVVKEGEVGIEYIMTETQPSQADWLRVVIRIKPVLMKGSLIYDATVDKKYALTFPDNPTLQLIVSNRSIDVNEDFQCEVWNARNNFFGAYWVDQENLGANLGVHGLEPDGDKLKIVVTSVDFSAKVSSHVRIGRSFLEKLGSDIAVQVAAAFVDSLLLNGIPIVSVAGSPIGRDVPADYYATWKAAQFLQNNLEFQIGK